MASLPSSDPRRFPLWGWLVLLGALVAAFAVVVGPGEEPDSDPLGPGMEELVSTPEEEGENGRSFADPGEIPEQPWASDLQLL